MNIEPRLGIFWGIWIGDGKAAIVPISVPEKEVPVIGGFRTLDSGHVDVWPEIQRTVPMLRGKEYDEVPRGRVNWREEDDRYLLIADRKLLGDDFLKEIMALFKLPDAKTLVMSDPHYRTPPDSFEATNERLDT